MSNIAFDIALVLLLVWLAWRVLAPGDELRAVVLFMVFGFLLAVAWLRLAAPDIALVEAAITAGFLGPMLVEVARQNRLRSERAGTEEDEPEAGP